MKRAFILLLDSFGLGATPDAAKYLSLIHI